MRSILRLFPGNCHRRIGSTFDYNVLTDDFGRYTYAQIGGGKLANGEVKIMEKTALGTYFEAFYGLLAA